MKVVEYYGYGTEYPPQQNMRQLGNNARQMGKTIIRLCNGREVVLVGTGSSGLAIATSVATHYPNMSVMYIRKPNEKSHGRMHEMAPEVVNDIHEFGSRKDYMYIFVDDFTCEGSTMARVMDEMFTDYAISFDAVALLAHYRPSDVERKLDSDANLPDLYIKSHKAVWQDGDEYIR